MNFRFEWWNLAVCDEWFCPSKWPEIFEIRGQKDCQWSRLHTSVAETCQTSQPICSDIKEETANERPRENCKPQMLNWNPLRTKTMIKRFSKVDFYKIGDPLSANPLSPFSIFAQRPKVLIAESDIRSGKSEPVGKGGRRRHKMVATIWCMFDSPWKLGSVESVKLGIFESLKWGILESNSNELGYFWVTKFVDASQRFWVTLPESANYHLSPNDCITARYFWTFHLCAVT